MSGKPDNIINHGPQHSHQEAEIDLLSLLTLLWEKRTHILLATFIFGFIGFLYAIIAPEQWTAHTTIYYPKQRDTLKLDQLRTILNIQGLGGAKNNESIYSDFLLEFKSYNNINNYLKTTIQFKEYVIKHNLNTLEQQRLLRRWSEWMTSSPEDKKGEQPGIHLSFSYFGREDALSILTGYIDYISRLQSRELIELLENNRKNQIDALNLKIKLKKEDAQRKLSREIKGVELSMSIANAAGVSKPLENFNYGDRFPITLGKDALARKLAILKSLTLEEYMPELTELNVQRKRLENIKLGEMKLIPFSYLDAPSQPLKKDKPKQLLIVVLATFIGGMLGIAMVLIQHAFKQRREDTNPALLLKSGNYLRPR